MLEETLPVEERVPFAWKGSNPLSFLKLFRRGRKLRLVAIRSIWSSLAGKFATFRYAEVHRQQMLGWGLAERGRYASFQGVFNALGSWGSGQIIRAIGTRKSTYLGYVSESLQQLATALSWKGWHFYAVRTMSVTADVSMVAMQYTNSAVRTC